MRPARSYPKLSIEVIGSRECEQIQPRDKRAVALWSSTDIGDLRAMPAMDPMLDPGSHLPISGDAVSEDIVVQIRDAQKLGYAFSDKESS
jgi:hypothetical protein